MPDTELAPDGGEAKTLDSILSSAIEEHYVDDSAPAAAAEPAAPTETPDIKLDDAGRARGPDGKFVSTDPAKTDAVAASDPAKVEATPALAPPVDTAPQPVEPHPTWKPELKAEFAKWTPEVQKAFRDRYGDIEADYTRKTQELSETRKAVEPLLNEATRHSPFLQQIGYTPDRFLTESVAVAQRLMSGSQEHKGQALAYLAQLHGIAPETVVKSLGISLNPGEAPQVNPDVAQLRQTIFELQQNQQRFESQQANWQRQQAQAEFDALGLTKGDDGKPKYPHFERVKGSMVQLVANGQSDSWDQAYTRAVRLDDDLYAQTIEAERTRVSQAEETRRQEAVAKAKKASPIAQSTGSSGGGSKVTGLDAHLEAALTKHGYA